MLKFIKRRSRPIAIESNSNGVRAIFERSTLDELRPDARAACFQRPLTPWQWPKGWMERRTEEIKRQSRGDR